MFCTLQWKLGKAVRTACHDRDCSAASFRQRASGTQYSYLYSDHCGHSSHASRHRGQYSTYLCRLFGHTQKDGMGTRVWKTACHGGFKDINYIQTAGMARSPQLSSPCQGRLHELIDPIRVKITDIPSSPLDKLGRTPARSRALAFCLIVYYSSTQRQFRLNNRNSRQTAKPIRSGS